MQQQSPDDSESAPALIDPGPSERGWHRLQSAMRCLRLYALREKAGLRFAPSAPLVNGSLLHVGLAHLYQRQKERQTGGNPDKWLTPHQAVSLAAQRGSDSGEAPHLWLSGVSIVNTALSEYMAHWDDRGWRILEVEKELRATIGGHLYTQRADLIVESNNTKQVFIVDHKSCYTIHAKTQTQHILDGQFIGYQRFGRALYGNQFSGVIVNRVKLKPPIQFARGPVEPAPLAVRDFPDLIVEVEKRIAEQESRPDNQDPFTWPPAFSSQVCTSKYGKCSAWNICRFGLHAQE